jgi:hypothetical protein
MILTSDQFADITDQFPHDTDILQRFGPSDKEKLCIVQKFINDCSDIGNLILSSVGEEYHSMTQEERNDLEKELCPKDINQEMFEEGVILALICGETDGNAGNYMVANTPNSQTGLRDIFKIDNACTFTETNASLLSGSVWVVNNVSKQLTPKGRDLIMSVNPDHIASLMALRGKSDQAIAAMRHRVEVMKVVEASNEDLTVDDLDNPVYAYTNPDEEEAVAIDQPNDQSASNSDAEVNKE